MDAGHQFLEIDCQMVQVEWTSKRMACNFVMQDFQHLHSDFGLSVRSELSIYWRLNRRI